MIANGANSLTFTLDTAFATTLARPAVPDRALFAALTKPAQIP
jgi:hypothetical protein